MFARVQSLPAEDVQSQLCSVWTGRSAVRGLRTCETSQLTERLTLYSAALVNHIHLHLNEALLAQQNEKYLLEKRHIGPLTAGPARVRLKNLNQSSSDTKIRISTVILIPDQREDSRVSQGSLTRL